ncbi:MAG: hypothetical protein KDA50_06185 [Rhodobacteraceae bacterium]|nr:hypothetical protein [Paracoccaceae bacterium]
MSPLILSALSTVALLAPCGDALAQAASNGWSFETKMGLRGQGEADIDGGGSVESSAGVLQFGARYGISPRSSVGVSVELGQGRYDFTDTARFGKDMEFRSDVLSLSYGFGVGDRGFGFVAPSVRWDGETGADADDAMTYGLSLGVAWRVSPSLTIGPALGLQTTLEDGTEAFPFLLVNWDITPRLNLSTGEGLGATQGPGLALRYAATDTVSIGIAARVEDVEFRLHDNRSGAAAGGTARDRSFPVVATLGWSPSDWFDLTAFAGVETNADFTLRDSGGSRIAQRDYDNAPIVGLVVAASF